MPQVILGLFFGSLLGFVAFVLSFMIRNLVVSWIDSWRAHVERRRRRQQRQWEEGLELREMRRTRRR